jgi:hypothetical protein
MSMQTKLAAFYKNDSLHQFQEFRSAEPSNSFSGTSGKHLGYTNKELVAYRLPFMAGSDFNLITFLTGSRTYPLDAWFYGTCPLVYQIGIGFLCPNPITI